MKKFFYKLIIFVMIILAIATGMQLLVSWRIRHKVIYGTDNLDLTAGQDNELVFLGSSRCYVHFDPRLFGSALHLKAANLGVDGHSDLTMHRLRLQNYLAKNKAPRYVILNFDPLVNAGSMEDNEHMVFKDEFARYAFWPSAANEPIVRYFKFNLVEKYVPLYAVLRYKLFPTCLTLPNHKDWVANGYRKVDLHWDTIAAPLSQWRTFDRNYSDTSAIVQDGIRRELKLLRDLCREMNIQLICVQTPVYKTIYRADHFSCSRSVCSSLGIPFVDANMPEINDNIGNFYNADHLNTQGVKVMTAALLSLPDFRRLFNIQ